MEQVMLKLCGQNANGIVQKAKRAFIEDASANAAKKRLKNGVIFNGGITAVNTINTAVQAYSGNPGIASIWGLCTALFGTSFGIYLKEFMQAVNTKKQTSQALKDIINKKDFKDIFNRYLRMNGMKEMTSEQIIAAYKLGKTVK